MFHYVTCNTSAVDIRSFKDYFVTTIETLLISQRKLHIKVRCCCTGVTVNLLVLVHAHVVYFDTYRTVLVYVYNVHVMRFRISCSVALIIF